MLHLFCVILLNGSTQNNTRKSLSRILCNKVSSNTYSDLISHTHKDTQHIQGLIDWHTHINIYLNNLLSTHSSCLYYVEWIIHWYQKCTLQSYITLKVTLRELHVTFTLHNVFAFHYSLVEVTYNETTFLPWNTKNTDREGINKENTHTHTKHS